jgi:hypothetical protein
MGKNGLIKLLAAGALVGAAAHLYKKHDGAQKKAALAKVANNVGKKVGMHAKRVGKVTKSSFKSIVDSVVDEYQDTKDMTAGELKELKTELMNGWDKIQAEFTADEKKKPSKKSKK